ncbi:FG-GAP and VCBS repeat-containing protein [Streptomyces sp. NBC_01241]|uniref:FG-GAP and VCBS repeat-containing protein n=1 Tax=Streptomyces sp. NBC_01241 TaxID=2903794 RepID=UPI00352EF84B|nr:FG-GAP and VCBS repeat-containing protein [Streptomyces sp. NBC_01241]
MAIRTPGITVVLAITVATAVITLPAAAQASTSAPATASATPTRAVPAPTPRRDDFNGDGYPDLAFTAPGATAGGRTKAGYAGVVYGSKSGLQTSTRQVFTQDSPGIPDTAEAGDAFGSSMVSADLDRDGYSDLVVGAPKEAIGSFKSAGSLTVIWGGAHGLSGGATLLTGNQLYDGIGGKAAVGDFDGDGAMDVVTLGMNGMHILSGPFERDGSAAAVRVIRDMDDLRYLDLAAGDFNGDGRDDLAAVVHDDYELDARRILVRNGGATGLSEKYTVVKRADGYRLQGGETVTAGHINGDKYADLVVGRTIEGYDSDLDYPLALGGMITYVPGSATGPRGDRAKVFNQDSAGVPGVAEVHDGFGASLSIGDMNGDGYGDIAVGVPYEDLGTTKNAGSVLVLPGTASGPTGTGTVGFNQDTANVPGVAEANDRFGAAVRLVDANRDGRTELAVGAPGENTHAGSLWVFPATASGVTAKGSFAFSHGTLGTVGTNAQLGSSFNR